ncbi:hypothetical protein ABZ471_40745 [Streptomyces sp. NPDC005728]|uniref:hypothetical protein n=1 Tax=Streptomyces sp. NPDC005728 TaxID=3157054 RepID=UPI0033E71C0A
MDTPRIAAGPAPTLRPWSVPRGLPVDEANGTPATRVQDRYIEDILRLNSRLSFGRLADELRKNGAALHQFDQARGLTTLVAYSESIPERYLLGLAGFRLAEYLNAGFASQKLVFDRSLFCEPIQAMHRRDIHVVTTHTGSGRIVGYVALAHSQDTKPRLLTDPARLLFPSEQVHGIQLQKLMDDPYTLTTHQIREVKRLVHAHSVTDRQTHLAITLELLAGISKAVQTEHPGLKLLIGDVEEHIALRHLVLLGLTVRLVQGTNPKLSQQDVLHPRYNTGEKVLPFYARIPDADGVAERVTAIERALADESPIRGLRGVMAELSGTVQYIYAPEGRDEEAAA